MNKDLELMIELQEYWDVILFQRQTIEKKQQEIANINAALDSMKAKMENMKTAIQEKKKFINEKENELSEKDEIAKKLKIKQSSIKTEKELTALENELKSLKDIRSELEDLLIQEMDKLSNWNGQLAEHKAILEKQESEGLAQITILTKAIQDAGKKEKEKLAVFEKSLPKIPNSYKSSFLAHLKGKNGKAVVLIEENVCSGCNSSIPVHIIRDASPDAKTILTCTNCARFIYTKP